MTGLALPALDMGGAQVSGDFRPYLHQYTCDSMEPTLRNRDFVIVVPVDHYIGEGLYLFDFFGDELDIYRCQSCGGGEIDVFKDNKLYTLTSRIPLARFNEAVRGKVYATCNVTDGSLLERPVSWRVRKAAAA